MLLPMLNIIKSCLIMLLKVLHQI